MYLRLFVFNKMLNIKFSIIDALLCLIISLILIWRK